jgi:hypothetical protein
MLPWRKRTSSPSPDVSAAGSILDELEQEVTCGWTHCHGHLKASLRSLGCNSFLDSIHEPATDPCIDGDLCQSKFRDEMLSPR